MALTYEARLLPLDSPVRKSLSGEDAYEWAIFASDGRWIYRFSAQSRGMMDEVLQALRWGVGQRREL